MELAKSERTLLTWPKTIKLGGKEIELSYDCVLVREKLTVTVNNPVPCYVNAIRRGFIGETASKRLALTHYSTSDIYLKPELISEILMNLPLPSTVKVGDIYKLKASNDRINTRKEIYTTDILDNRGQPLKTNKMIFIELSTAKQVGDRSISTNLELNFVVNEHSPREQKCGGYQLAPRVGYDIDLNPMDMTIINNGDGNIIEQWNKNIDAIMRRIVDVIAVFKVPNAFTSTTVDKKLTLFQITLINETPTIAEMLSEELHESMPNEIISCINYMQYKEDINYRFVLTIDDDNKLVNYTVAACETINKKLKSMKL